MRFTFESFFILVMTIGIIVANVLIMLVLFKTEQLRFVNKYFLVSLTVADLMIGVFVTPFSFVTSLFDRWIYGEKFCHLEAYLAAIFWIASVYSLCWISIDHYVAIRKPDRHDNLMTPMRCACWITFVWVAALSFCCPPLFGVARAKYYPEANLCIIDWDKQKAYFITSGILIIVPPVVALTITNLYIFTDKYRQKKSIYEKCYDCDSRPDHYFLNFLVGAMVFLTWMPWCILQMAEIFRPGPIIDHSISWAPPQLHFYFMWIAVGNSLWKFLLYVGFDHDFRIGLKMLFTNLTCGQTL